MESFSNQNSEQLSSNYTDSLFPSLSPTAQSRHHSGLKAQHYSAGLLKKPEIVEGGELKENGDLELGDTHKFIVKGILDLVDE